jgi:cytoskeletal protein CcmA (bactofilin family)
MGFFSQTGNSRSDAAPPAIERRRHRETNGGLSIVAKDLTVTGDLEAAGVIRVEGRVLGNVQAGDQVLLSEGGVIEGNVSTREAVVGGTVHGSITAADRVELQAGAVVEGDIATPRLLIQEGGRVNGGVRMEAVTGDRWPVTGDG